jgi:2'-5' RNA ligase
MNRVLRLFIAISLPVEIQCSLNQVSSDLRFRLKNAPVRWVRPDNIHLTLKFLGDVHQANLDAIQQALEVEAQKARTFEITIGGLGVFPNQYNPRVIVIKVQVPPGLIALQRGIESQTDRLGYPHENRPFSPHLTLGRVDRHTTRYSPIQRNPPGLPRLPIGCSTSW